MFRPGIVCCVRCDGNTSAFVDDVDGVADGGDNDGRNHGDEGVVVVVVVVVVPDGNDDDDDGDFAAAATAADDNGDVYG